MFLFINVYYNIGRMELFGVIDLTQFIALRIE